MTVLPAAPPAQMPSTTPDFTMAFLAPVLTTAIIIIGIVLVVAISLYKTDGEYRAEILRAVADVFRRRGGPPGTT